MSVFGSVSTGEEKARLEEAGTSWRVLQREVLPRLPVSVPELRVQLLCHDQGRQLLSGRQVNWRLAVYALYLIYMGNVLNQQVCIPVIVCFSVLLRLSLFFFSSRPLDPDETPSEASAAPLPPDPCPIPNTESPPSKQVVTRKTQNKKYSQESLLVDKSQKEPAVISSLLRLFMFCIFNYCSSLTMKYFYVWLVLSFNAAT